MRRYRYHFFDEFFRKNEADRRYHNGKKYNIPYYGYILGTRLSFIASIIIGLLWSFIGLIIIFFLSTVTKSATIINTKPSFDRDYVIYEFEYNYLGKSYVGNSKERLGYSGQEYHVGDTLEIYVYSYDGSKYELRSNARYILFVILILVVPGFTEIGISIYKRKMHLKDLEEIGDINNDGIIDEKDFNALPTIPNVTNKKCPNCGESIYSKALICPKCKKYIE